MKKILSVFTAVALLFGFASCNGDMHEVDSEKQKDAFGLAIVGITNDPGNHVIPMNLDTPDRSEQSLKITFTDGFEFTGTGAGNLKQKNRVVTFSLTQMAITSVDDVVVTEFESTFSGSAFNE